MKVRSGKCDLQARCSESVRSIVFIPQEGRTDKSKLIKNF